MKRDNLAPKGVPRFQFSVVFDTPTRITNASVDHRKEPLRLAEIWTGAQRAGSGDAFKCPSRGQRT